MRRASVAALGLVVALATAGPVAAQDSAPTMQDEIVAAVIESGYWDESGTLDAGAMAEVVDEHGSSFAFAYTDRAFAVERDPDRSAAALLSLSALEALQVAGGPRTLLMVTDDDATGATTEFAFANVVDVLSTFDRDDPEASFAAAATEIARRGDDVTALSGGPAQTGILEGWALFIGLGAIAAALGVASLGSRKKKIARRTHTAPARDSTRRELQAMSDLILDLDPRVTIANDADLKRRYVDASDTYRAVLEKAEAATTGHEVADLRIDIAKARWKLDVIDAELDGRDAPPEPFMRDTTGSAWDSTRGTGGGRDGGPRSDS